jgi:upstream activation factor subunit UAF30
MQDAIKELIMERFDKVQSDVTAGAPEPAPTANGAHHDDDDDEASPKKRKANENDDESELSELANSPPPKKAKKKTKIDAESDEAYARNLQAEINGEKRATRGGGATKKKPVAKQAKKPKKKSSSKVSAADDSDLASGSEKPEKEKKGGFHVSVFYCVRQVAILTNFLETHEPLRATGRNAWSAGPLTTTDCKADLGICQGA